MNCELISVGTEILLGDILNSNVQFLSKELASLGINVMRHTTVGDNEARLLKALDDAFESCQAVILTGGLGPTPDDLTKETCCRYFSIDLREDGEILRKIESYFRLKNIDPMPQCNKKQALVPTVGRVLENNNGTAPGFILEKDEKIIVILPGPPKEMIPMYRESVKPYLKQFTNEVIVSHNIRTFGIGESYMSEKVEDLLDGSNPTVAPYAKSGEALLRVTAKAASEKEAEELMKPVIDEIKTRLGNSIYGIDSASIEQTVVELLKNRQQTAAFAESCTGGLCAKRITDISGASEVFHCGIVSYSNDIKHSVLGVKQETLDRFTAVSAETAREMAEGARKLADADYGISLTGYAGPGYEEDVGLIYIAVADKNETVVKKLLTGHRGNNCRDYNRHVAASNAFNQLRLAILKNDK
ncbi:MAG: competence/damage-inducible protein A [Clostridia bacterium]|nr:competence/damage-inducible protein A [Clostridia bacterium]